MIPEFIGRLQQLITIDCLDVNMLIKVLKEPKNSLILQYKKLFGLNKIDLEITNEAIKIIAKISYCSNSGARGLKLIIENVLLESMFEIPSITNIKKIIIEGKNIIFNSRLKYIYQ